MLTLVVTIITFNYCFTPSGVAIIKPVNVHKHRQYQNRISNRIVLSLQETPLCCMLGITSSSDPKSLTTTNLLFSSLSFCFWIVSYKWNHTAYNLENDFLIHLNVF